MDIRINGIIKDFKLSEDSSKAFLTLSPYPTTHAFLNDIRCGSFSKAYASQREVTLEFKTDGVFTFERGDFPDLEIPTSRIRLSFKECCFVFEDSNMEEPYTFYDSSAIFPKSET